MRHTVERLDGETETIGLVSNGELERGVNVSLFHVSTNVDVSGSSPSVGESMNQPRVRVEGNDDGLVSSEDAVKLLVGETCAYEGLASVFAPRKWSTTFRLLTVRVVLV